MTRCKIFRNSSSKKTFTVREMMSFTVREMMSFTVREMMFGFRDEFEYFECATCGCLRLKVSTF